MWWSSASRGAVRSAACASVSASSSFEREASDLASPCRPRDISGATASASRNSRSASSNRPADHIASAWMAIASGLPGELASSAQLRAAPPRTRPPAAPSARRRCAPAARAPCRRSRRRAGTRHALRRSEPPRRGGWRAGTAARPPSHGASRLRRRPSQRGSTRRDQQPAYADPETGPPWGSVTCCRDARAAAGAGARTRQRRTGVGPRRPQSISG